MNKLQNVFRNQGRFADAVLVLQDKLQGERQLDQALFAQSFDAVGLALDGASRHREARAAYSLAVPIWRRLGMLDHLGTTLHNIGLSYRRCGSDEDAVRHYKEAVQVRPDLLCEDDPSSHHLANLCTCPLLLSGVYKTRSIRTATDLRILF
ncbi:hypothetical protein R3P38DRAFT_2815428 [Favolaschia claudopus]|uniref:Tetratricopeptide repeat protein n=1 Tax=Favolaschia claudopus TaxID=2862362 RepID=A0AAV9Z180_9AGAR